MRFFVVFLLCFWSISAKVNAQASPVPKAVKAWEEGKALLKKQEPEKARKAFEKATQLDPSYYDAHADLASLLLRTKDSAAIKHLERLVDLDPAKDPYVWLALGRMHRELSHFTQSTFAYQQFLHFAAPDHEQRDAVIRELANVQFTGLALEQPVPFVPIPLDSHINMPGATMQYGPTFTGDGRTVIFTRRIDGNEDFYMARKMDDGWSDALPLSGINTLFNEGMQTISRDGQTMIFTWCHDRQGYGSCDLYLTHNNVSVGWTKPVNLGPVINTRDWDAQPTLSADGRTLVFSSTRPGGAGESDLWWVQKDTLGNWSGAVPLPGMVNTAGKEQTPFLHADGQTLYFSSTGHAGLGDFDLYVSRYNKETGWQQPVNLGYPINTAGHEGAMSLGLDGYTAYFATDRMLAERGRSGLYIYSFELPDFARGTPVTFVEGYVRDANTKKGLKATIRFKALVDDKAEVAIEAAVDGYYMICLTSGLDYGMQMDHPGYQFYTDHFALSDSSMFHPYRIDVGLIPEDRTDKTTENRIVLRNILFATGSAKLLPESTFDLQRIAAYLQSNPGLHIRLEGHTDNVGRPEENLTLSSERANAVKEWLIKQGIDPRRLSSLGMGDRVPVSENESARGRQLNRRTEMVILP
jgi:outer membrane protein OmpA-like peptidoglycan-associated protein